MNNISFGVNEVCLECGSVNGCDVDKQQGGVKLLFWNAHGMRNMYDMDKSEYMVCTKFSIICICETWLCNNFNNSYFLNNYKIHEVSATKFFNRGRASGGLLVLVKKGLNSRVIASESSFIALDISCNNKKIIVILIYFKPDNRYNGLNSLKEFLINF